MQIRIGDPKQSRVFDLPAMWTLAELRAWLHLPEKITVILVNGRKVSETMQLVSLGHNPETDYIGFYIIDDWQPQSENWRYRLIFKRLDMVQSAEAAIEKQQFRKAQKLYENAAALSLELNQSKVGQHLEELAEKIGKRKKNRR